MRKKEAAGRAANIRDKFKPRINWGRRGIHPEYYSIWMFTLNDVMGYRAYFFCYIYTMDVSPCLGPSCVSNHMGRLMMECVPIQSAYACSLTDKDACVYRQENVVPEREREAIASMIPGSIYCGDVENRILTCEWLTYVCLGPILSS